MPKLKKNGKEYEVAEWQAELLKGKPGWQEVKTPAPAKPKEKDPQENSESPA